eukprot:6432803-Alexandrium_andersonii.AAC.1
MRLRAEGVADLARAELKGNALVQHGEQRVVNREVLESSHRRPACKSGSCRSPARGRAGSCGLWPSRSG